MIHLLHRVFLLLGVLFSLSVSASALESLVVQIPGLAKTARPLKLLRIPAGSFQMGASETERFAYPDEKPRHKVVISKDYYIGETEVTQAQWKAVMSSQPAGYYGMGDNYPVYYVSWDDCNLFLKKLSNMSGLDLRLPTEAEWEYACRGSVKNTHRNAPFSFGGGQSDSMKRPSFNPLFDKYMIWSGNSRMGTEPVASKRPNDYGLYDMHGNVWEWCNDWYHREFYKHPEAMQPDPVCTDPYSHYRVLRGGGWYNLAWYCRSAHRMRGYASDARDMTGLRVALSIKKESKQP
jgi:formylglycine-generating enzyme required for sulfatase activity